MRFRSCCEVVRPFFAGIRDFFLPTLCPVCGQEIACKEQILCPVCHATIPRYRMNDPYDNSVVRRLWTEADVLQGGALMIYHRNSPFCEPLLRFKYKGDTDLGIHLGKWVCRELNVAQWKYKIDVVVPMPMNKRRKRLHGYNQTSYLAQGIAKELGCRMSNYLIRVDALESQTHKRKHEREESKIEIEAHIPETERGLSLLLVDDVITTGRTLRQGIAALLKEDATARISVLTLASADEARWS